MSGSGLIIGVNVGGTFTDFFLLDPAAGTFATKKVPSHRGDKSRGFLTGLAELARTGGRGAASGSIVHGTTVGTNSILERRGPRIGVITTRGFRDVLEMRRRDRRRTWGLWGDFTPIAQRDMRLEVGERTLADGTIRQGVDLDEVRAAAKLLGEKGAHSVAVVFVNAYANPENERRAAAELRALWPNEYVCASHEVLAEIREFERFSTTAINAFLQPVVAAYLGKVEQSLARQKFSGQLHIVQSNGGIMSAASARRFPVRTALSGPAAGVVAGAALARAAGFENVITCDLGGTSFDVCVVAGGKAAVAAQTTIDFGLVIRTPMIEITSIGAGGGSIASVDRGGLLQRARKCGLGSRACVLRTRQRAAHAHRRADRARPDQCFASARWRAQDARCGGREASRCGSCRCSARPRPSSSRRSGCAGRGGADGGSNPARFH